MASREEGAIAPVVSERVPSPQTARGRTLRIAFVSSHPVPYHVPTYRALASHPSVDLEVLYTHTHGVTETFDAGFGRAVKFDVPLLEGYRYRFLNNIAVKPGLHFAGQMNPELPLAIARGDYDAVVVHGYQSASTVAALIVPRGRRTRVLLRSESILNNPKRSVAKRAAKQVLLRALFARIDHFLAIGTLSQQYFQTYGVPLDRITIAPYTVDNEYFERRSADARNDQAEARRRLGLPTDRAIFLYCSKIVAHKRPLDVLRAFARARSVCPAALVYVGDGAQMPELQAEITRLAIGQDVHVLGFRNQSDLPEIYGACDVFVQASEREPWGMVVNEAMACGLAICASDQVGSSYDLIADNGAQFPAGNIERLAEALLQMSADSAKLTRMKAASLRRIREWTASHTAQAVVDGVLAARGETRHS